jgi:hypothetical protein
MFLGRNMGSTSQSDGNLMRKTLGSKNFERMDSFRGNPSQKPMFLTPQNVPSISGTLEVNGRPLSAAKQ